MVKTVTLTAVIECSTQAEYNQLDGKTLEEIGLWVESKSTDLAGLRITYTGSHTLPW